MDKYYLEQNIPVLRFSKSQTGSFPAHIHEDIELKCVYKGSQYAHSDGKTNLLKEGSIFLACPNQVHGFSNSQEECFAYLVIIKPSALGACGRFLMEHVPKQAILDAGLDSTLWKLLEMCYEEYTQYGEQPALYALLTAFFNMLQRQMSFDKEDHAPGRSIRGVLRYCAEHYREDISLKSLSQAMFLSQSHVSHIFSQKLKISFPDYINSLRVAEAARLIQAGHHSISEAASSAGFTTIRTFNRAFHKHYGVSPSEYKKRG